MKVILLNDVAKVGQRGQVKDVPDGYGRNFLIARGLAKPATLGLLAAHEHQDKSARQKREKEFTLVDGAIAGATSAQPFIVVRSANPEGALFAGLKADDLVSELNKKGFFVPTASVHLEKPIKKTGNYEVVLSSPSGKKTVLMVEVKGE
ncbi:MAG: 50S ribosomal protein L9 [Patescibacteria group bacterium]